MSAGILSFGLGMKDAGFKPAMADAMKSMDGVRNRSAALAHGLQEGEREVIGMRERVELLRHSLDTMGGPLAKLSDLTRLALDPMTLGFAAVFGAVELYKGAIERAAKRSEMFIESSHKVTEALAAINEARPSSESAWVEFTEQMGRLGERFQDVRTFGENFLDMLRNSGSIRLEQADATLDIEQQKIKLLVEQGRLSAEDGDRRIASLKNQALLQKNLIERQNITKQITALTGERTDLVARARTQPGLRDSTAAKINADNVVTDLKHQIEGLPKAIARSEQQKFTAEQNARNTSGLEAAHWRDLAHQAGSTKAELQDALENAKAQLPAAVAAAARADEGVHNATGAQDRVKDLTTQITNLQNKLGQTAQRQNALTPLQIQKNNLDALTKMNEGGNHYTPSPTSLEKMGFVMGGNQNALDYSRRTALATERIAASIIRQSNPVPSLGQGLNLN